MNSIMMVIMQDNTEGNTQYRQRNIAAVMVGEGGARYLWVHKFIKVMPISPLIILLHFP